MTAEVEAEILDLLRAQEAANTRGDAEGVVAPMSDDIVSYDLPPPLQHRGAGKAATDALDAWFDTWDGPVTVELVNPTVFHDGDLAVVHGLSRMRGRKKGAGSIDCWNRRTVVLRRSGAHWTIVHEHSSYPTAMDGSGRSATDLAP